MVAWTDMTIEIYPIVAITRFELATGGYDGFSNQSRGW